MNFKICKLHFTSAVHFGEGGLTTSADTLMADTIFAALCSESAMQGEGVLDKLVGYASAGQLLLSDGLPFIGKTLYVPRPVLEIQGREEGNSAIKKALKKLRYLPLDQLDTYLCGEMEIDVEAKRFQEGFSGSSLLEKATVPEKEVTRPYAVAVRRYKEGSGLYLCVGYESEEAFELFLDLLEQLSWSGVGGERSSGYGRFESQLAACGEELLRRLRNTKARKYMSLSVSLPADDEMDGVISGAACMAVKRSGWVSSPDYADSLRKKKDLYMLAAGSVFSGRFSGGVFDVSDGGNHPVYRYGRPMLMALA